MKRIKILIFFLLLFIPISIIKAETNTVDLYLFYGDGCPHCAEEEEFLDEYLKDKDYIELHKYEVWHNTENQELLVKVQDAINNHASGVPYLVIGNKPFVGYYDGVTNLQIEDQIEKVKNQKNYVDKVKKVLNNEKIDDNEKTPVTVYLFSDNSEECNNVEEYLNNLNDDEELGKKFAINKYDIKKEELNDKLKKKVIDKLNIKEDKVPIIVIGNKYLNDFSSMDKINELINSEYENKKYKDIVSELDTTEIIPFFGKVDVTSVSLPLIALIMGLVDGFNPCAMWILIFLMSILIGMKDKKKLILFGLVFITTSALFYFLLMFTWLQAIAKISVSLAFQIVLAIFAIGAGIYNLVNYYKALKKDDGCAVTSKKQKKNIMIKIKKLTQEKNILIGLLGIITLAISVNFVELLCSAGLPMMFTEILSLNQVSGGMAIIYNLIYVFFFMIDDIIIFLIAVKTMNIKVISTKFSKYSHLAAGIIMLIIGILLIFKPEWVMFKF